MATRKRVKFSDLSAEELVNEYKLSVRGSWAWRLENPTSDPDQSSSYHRELALKKELLRRLSKD